MAVAEVLSGPQPEILGLEKYEAAFRENEIDETVLVTLTAEHDVA